MSKKVWDNPRHRFGNPALNYVVVIHCGNGLKKPPSLKLRSGAVDPDSHLSDLFLEDSANSLAFHQGA